MNGTDEDEDEEDRPSAAANPDRYGSVIHPAQRGALSATMKNMENEAVTQPAKVRRKVYSVPRRYDLATLLVVSVAFSLLFAALRLLSASPAVFFLIVLFITFVAAGQALAPSAPRAASAVAGAVAFALLMGITLFFQGAIIAAVAGLICTLPQGALLGYVAGTLVGSVFMVADYGRRLARRIRSG